MAIITTSNLSLKVVAKTKGNTTYSITGASVPQKFRVKGKRRSYGNTVITDGHITKNYTTSTSLSRTGAGTSSEISTYTLSATMPLNKNLKIASISIAPATGYSLLREPKTVLRKSIDGLKVILDKSNTANTYDLILNINREIKEDENVIIDLNYLISKAPATIPSNTIKKLSVGGLNIPLSGCDRIIKINGAPNTPFELSILNQNDKSIISDHSEDEQGNPTTSVLPSGVKNVLSSTLNKRGQFNLRQTFPPALLVINTAVNGSMAASGASKIIFDSLTNVSVGDRLIATDSKGKRINNGELIKVVTLNPDTDNVNECTLSKSVTLADNKKVSFIRGNTFKITVTFNATTTSGTTQINGGTAGASHTTSYGSQPNKKIRKVTLVYTLTNRTFTSKSNHPVIAHFVTASGDAIIDGSVLHFGSGTSSYKIVADLNIEYGTSDTVININLDNIVTYS